MRTLLIDGDTLIFEAAAAHEYEAEWSPWLWTLHSDFEQARVHLDDSITAIVTALKADHFIVALSDEARWRPLVMESYKAKRTKTRKPVVYQPLREYCRERYDVYQRPTLEGDDVLGVLATHPKLVEGEKIVVSIDKDMKTIPGLHLNYQHAKESGDYEASLLTISQDAADYYHLYQTLTGDQTDNYPGCPGIGPVKAEKLIGLESECWSREGFDACKAWSVIVAAYAKAGLGVEVALQNARVARICRAEDYDFKKKEVKLWNPPQ